MHFRTVLFVILCLTLPEWSSQQYRVGRNNSKYSAGTTRFYVPKEPSNWKAILIIVVSVLFVATIIYGASCFYVCKMHFFERTEKKYTKMDSCVHV